jgi:HEAT repeat protein
LSAARTDRRALALALAAAALAAAPGTAPARAGDDSFPVFFRDPDRRTAEDIRKAINTFASPSPNDRERGRNLLFDIGYWTVPPLLETMEEKKSQFRTNAILVVMRLLDPRPLPAIRRVLRDGEQEWPPAIAALALGKYRDDTEEGFGLLRKSLADRENDKRRVACCLALAKLHRRRGPDCWPELERALDARAPKVAVESAAVLALGFFRGRVAEADPGGAGFVPTKRILAALRDRRSDLRLSAVLAMSVAYNNSFHEHFLRAWRDSDREVRGAALLALGRNLEPATTDFLVEVLGNTDTSNAEKRMAAYLLSRRPDALKGNRRALDGLHRAATSGKDDDLAAAAVIALAGVEDDAVGGVLARMLGHPSSTVRAAVAVGSVRLRSGRDLETVRDALVRRVEAGETDRAARTDMKLAIEEIGRILKDRKDAAEGKAVEPREPPPWEEADAQDLFLEMGRSERQRTFDLVNLRAIQVLGIEGLMPYRPTYDPDEPASGLGGGGGGAGGAFDHRNSAGQVLDQYDLRVELARRPYFVPEEDDPDAPAVPLPRPK